MTLNDDAHFEPQMISHAHFWLSEFLWLFFIYFFLAATRNVFCKNSFEIKAMAQKPVQPHNNKGSRKYLSVCCPYSAFHNCIHSSGVFFIFSKFYDPRGINYRL